MAPFSCSHVSRGTVAGSSVGVGAAVGTLAAVGDDAAVGVREGSEPAVAVDGGAAVSVASGVCAGEGAGWQAARIRQAGNSVLSNDLERFMLGSPCASTSSPGALDLDE